MNVTALHESQFTNAEGKVVKVTDVTFDDGSKAPGYDLPEIPRIGKPLPQGWEVAVAKSGKPYIKVPKDPSKKREFSVAHRNTKEGQAYEQERMDRRTALMQAVTYGASSGSKETVKDISDIFYTWLRQTVVEGGAALASSGGPGRKVPSSATPPSEPVIPPVAGSDEGEVGGSAVGEDASPPPTPAHLPVWVDAESLGGRKGWELCSVPASDGGTCWLHSARRKAPVPA